MALLSLTEEAEAQLQIGDYLGAQDSITRALAIDPSNPGALQLQAEILRRKGGAN
jgi:Tfp pilus assembly protein PilF